MLLMLGSSGRLPRATVRRLVAINLALTVVLALLDVWLKVF